MFLQRLCEYADQLGLPPLLYQERVVRYGIQLTEEGRYLNIIEYSGVDNKAGVPMLVPDVKRNGISPYILADTGEYVLGIPGKKSTRQNSAKGTQEDADRRHAAFVTLVEDCAQQTGEPSVVAVAHFLASFDQAQLHLPPDFSADERVIFEVGQAGVRPMDVPAVRAYWLRRHEQKTEDAQCLVCGYMRPPVQKLPITIKGIPGGQVTGMALISAYEDACWSYGLVKSLASPTCEDCGQRFSHALNHLLRDYNTHYRQEDCVYIYWLGKGATFDVNKLMRTPEQSDVRPLLDAARSGKRRAAAVDVTPFYAATLSAQGARVVVRDWMEMAISEAKEHLTYYFALQQVVDVNGEIPPFSIGAMAATTVLDATKKKTVAKAGQLLFHFALKGGTLPIFLLQKVVRRIRAEQKVNRAQVACIKMVLLSQPDLDWLRLATDMNGASLPISREERMFLMMECDPSVTDPAYLCGRLLSILESIQYNALKGINATIVDRYYGAASATPASVFGRLLRLARTHLSKIEKSKPGAYVRLDKQLGEVLSHFHSNRFPTTLTLVEQGRFALGYYHQRTTDIQQGILKKSEKLLAEGTPDSELDDGFEGGLIESDDADEVENDFSSIESGVEA